MKDILKFDAVDPVLKPYYGRVIECLDKCIEDCNTLYNLFSENDLAVFKPRTKGSFINDRLMSHMKNHFASDPNIKIIEARGVFGIIVADKLFIRFNKMDEKFRTSINKKTGQTKRFLNQISDIPGLSDITLLWGGYFPNKTWSEINGYYLVCFNNGFEWSYDMGRNKAVSQLSMDIPVIHPQENIKRVSVKKDIAKIDTKEGTNH